jgi:hypothetical protein
MSNKVEELSDRLDTMAGKTDVPPGMLPMQRGLYGMTLEIMLLDCAEDDKIKGAEKVNAELVDKMQTKSGLYDEITEVLRLRRWFMERGRLDELVGALCYTSDRNQLFRDLEAGHADLRNRPKQPPDSQLEGSSHE